MAASILIWMAFGAALVSAFAYFQSATKRRMLVPLARRSFLAMTAGVLAASVLLMVFILRHQFEYAYVWSYSSRDLPPHLLLTTFWAGQEGSFMFWALCSTIIGFGLLNYSRRKHIEYETMAVYGLLQAFLLLLLVVKSPFTYIWDAFPTQVQIGSVPTDGKGLNPLLQNFWMIIHPPVLFIGFAAMAVPFAMAVAALWKRRYDEWIVTALPWALFAAIALGAGLMLGGYWAYGVLGWGGWWGWDPVENSSLVPWIIVVALLHTLVVQRKTGKLMRTNFALAILGFVLVIYSTFLTRSGILGDSSVHSFADPGMFAYTLLMLWMSTVTTIGIAMVAVRWNELKTRAKGVGTLTRESLIAMGSAALGASATVIFFGTSLPIFSNSSVDTSFYDNMNLPIAVILMIVLGLSLLVQWRMESAEGLLRRSWIGAVSALVCVLLFVIAGATDPAMLALGAASVFALAINIERIVSLARVNPGGTGGAIAHVGLALLFLGIIASGRYGQKTTVSLPLETPKEVFGHTLTYSGSSEFDHGKYRFTISATGNGSEFKLFPVMYQAEYNNSLMREPDYRSGLTGDFYVEPVGLESQADHDHAPRRLAKGESVTIGAKSFTFLRFDMDQHGGSAAMGSDGFVIGAVIEIRESKKVETVIARARFRENSTPEPTPVSTKDKSFDIRLVGMNVDMETRQSTVDLLIEDPTGHQHTATEVLVIEASVKPFMSVVWVAAFLVLAGMALALVRSRQATIHLPIPEEVRKSNGKRPVRHDNVEEHESATV